LKLPLITKANDAEQIRKSLIHAAVTLDQSEKPFYNTVDFLMSESDSEVLIARLKTIAMVLDTNPALHQRSFFSFFTGKHSESIHKFATDINRITEEYKDDPEQLKVEALNTLISFHHKLEEGSSRRTIEALSKITNDMVGEQSHSNRYN
jgi:predicted type IV restriction endonuclease